MPRPQRPTSTAITEAIQAGNFQVQFDVDYIDETIKNHGVSLVHYRAMQNPVGMISRYDSRRPDPDLSDASNGLIYTKAGCFTALLIGNSKNTEPSDAGFLDASSAQITPARFYDCAAGCEPEQIYLLPMDRLYLSEERIVVPQYQMVDASQTGVDRLRFPATKILDLVDARGIRYTPGDYKLVDGDIHWTGQNRPGTNVTTGTERPYSVRYFYRPYWVVDRLMHEIRVTRSVDPLTGDSAMVQMPQCADVQREYVYRNEKQDPEAPTPDSPRQQESPPSGGFGPR